MGNFHISLSLASVAGYMYLAGQLPYYTKKRVGKVNRPQKVRPKI